jgi:hypothetical protein
MHLNHGSNAEAHEETSDPEIRLKEMHSIDGERHEAKLKKMKEQHIKMKKK